MKAGALALAATVAWAAASATAPCRAEGSAPRRPAIETPGGVPVTFVSKDPALEIYLAHGDVPARTVPDPYERVGLVPLTVALAPGKYSVETASATSSTGHARFSVEQGAPFTVTVRPGEALVKALGTTLVALGAVATLLGVVAIVSISPDDSRYSRFGIGLPLVLGGVGGVGVGVTMTVLGSTAIDAPHLPPGGRAKTSSRVPGLSIRF